MHGGAKWLIASVSGAVAAIFGQYGLFLALVAAFIVLDVVTGLIKSKATGEGLSSEKAMRGFWKKMSLFAALLFGIVLDFAACTVLLHAGVSVGGDTPFALIICSYIIINEAISIAENLYLTNPNAFPSWISRRLKVARGEAGKEEHRDRR